MNPPDEIYHRYLASSLPKALKLAAASAGRLTIEPEPADPPAAYIARFRCRGYVRDTRTGAISTNDDWLFGIRFPEDFVKVVRPGEVVTLLHPLGSREAWHANLRGPFCCLTLKPGMDIEQILWAIHDLITGNKFNIAEPLNPAAAEWLRNNPTAYPADRRPLVGSSNLQPATVAP